MKEDEHEQQKKRMKRPLPGVWPQQNSLQEFSLSQNKTNDLKKQNFDQSKTQLIFKETSKYIPTQFENQSNTTEVKSKTSHTNLHFQVNFVFDPSSSFLNSFATRNNNNERNNTQKNYNRLHESSSQSIPIIQ